MAMIECPNCGKHFYNYQEKAGETIKCPHCEQDVNKVTSEIKNKEETMVNASSNQGNKEKITASAMVGGVQNSTNKNNAVESSIGNTLKTLALVCMVISILGSLVFCVQVSSAFGICAIIASLVLWLLVYAAGEICSLLTQINAKLGKLDANRI